MSGKSIEAILRLNTEPFESSLTTTRKAVNTFKNSMLNMGKDSVTVERGITNIQRALSTLIPYLQKFVHLTSETKTFRQFANGLKTMSEAVMNLSNVTKTSQVGIIRIKEIMRDWSNAVKGLTVNIRGSSSELEKHNARQREMQQHMANLRNSYESSIGTLNRFARAIQEDEQGLLRVINPMQQYSKALEVALPPVRSLITGNVELANAERQVASSSTQSANTLQRESVAKDKATASTNRLSASTSRLRNTMNSLRMMGTMVGSMLAYNFAHKLLVATGETIHAKSEMEGYFKMLNFGQSEVDDFNKALDDTVSQFQRVNKYSLGETISSIGVEFNLTTEEMKKAMKVTSMITSEYLRAGRNANEASLAVKDVLQGQFQRLSRETGVKGEQLKEAGWSGDTTDVLGLMEALEKVAQDRNWDVFAEKANSLNDILTITQNRFGEWAADMVNVVQPTIVNAFNSIMSFAQGVAQGLSSLWKWLNTDGWTQTATKIGMVTSAILVLMPTLTAYRSGATLLEVANMGVAKSLTALVFGIKAEEMANLTATESIGMKILGLEAEEVAQSGLLNVIRAKVLGVKVEKLTTEMAATGNYKFIGSLYALITGETLATAETLSLSGALALLTGAFLSSPIGWFTLAVLGLASAFYILTGGLDSSWDEMKKFNETMKNAGDEQKKAQKYLADLKEEVGENSQAYKDAKESVENWKGELQSASYWMDHSTKRFEEMNLRMSTSSKPILRDLGVDEKDMEEFDARLSHLTLGKNKYYKAEQVLNAQLYNEHSNYNEDLKEYLKNVKENGGDLEEAYERISGNYANLAEHSYIANTTDDWWEWMWNSLYAGMDQFWIDWDNFWASPNWSGAIDGLIKGLGNFNGIKQIFENLGINGDTITQVWDDFWKSVSSALENWQLGAIDFLKPLNDLGDEVNKFLDNPMEYLGLGDVNIAQAIMDALWGQFDIFGEGAYASDGSSDHPSIMEDISNIIGFDIQTWVANFTSDPLGTLGVGQIDIVGVLLPQLFGLIDGATSVWQFVNDNIITPLTSGLMNGILNIPLVGYLVGLFNIVTDDSIGADEKGKAIGQWIGNGLTTAIGQIPIVGDILRMLGLIPQTNGDAHQKGHGVGSNITQGTESGMGNLGSKVLQEFQDALSGIGALGQQAYDTAKGWADQLWQGVNSVLQRASPGFFHDQFKAEFGTDIPNAINEASYDAYAVGQNYATQIKDGVSSVSNEVGLQGMVDNYESDAQIVSDSSQMMGVNTTTAFNDMSLAVNQTTSQMQSNVVSSYSAMDTKQSSLLNNMKTKNTSAYNEMYMKSNQSLMQMRDSTSNITTQMTHAWTMMKDNIVKSATQLQRDSTVHFNSLSNTIGNFYGKIQNPSRWGSGSPKLTSSSARPRVGRAIAKNVFHGAGPSSKYTGSSTMSIGALKNMLCPNGDCNGIFDGYTVTDVVDVNQFLRSIGGEHGFGWGDWNGRYYSHIKTKSDAWSTGSPVIKLAGGIPTSAKFKVGDFNNGTPKISFGEFQAMAGSIFDAIPYKHYMDSSWKGSWLGALQAGACNCSDGADALIAFANSCGYSGYKQWGTWDGEGHFWAVINGTPMDTTAWQNGYGWTSPKVHGYGPSSSPKTSNEYNVNVVIEGDVYGVDDLNSKIEEGIDKGLQKHFNKSYAVGI